MHPLPKWSEKQPEFDYKFGNLTQLEIYVSTV